MAPGRGCKNSKVRISSFKNPLQSEHGLVKPAMHKNLDLLF